MRKAMPVLMLVLFVWLTTRSWALVFFLLGGLILDREWRISQKDFATNSVVLLVVGTVMVAGGAIKLPWRGKWDVILMIVTGMTFFSTLLHEEHEGDEGGKRILARLLMELCAMALCVAIVVAGTVFFKINLLH